MLPAWRIRAAQAHAAMAAKARHAGWHIGAVHAQAQRRVAKADEHRPQRIARPRRHGVSTFLPDGDAFLPELTPAQTRWDYAVMSVTLYSPSGFWSTIYRRQSGTWIRLAAFQQTKRVCGIDNHLPADRLSGHRAKGVEIGGGQRRGQTARYDNPSNGGFMHENDLGRMPCSVLSHIRALPESRLVPNFCETRSKG